MTIHQEQFTAQNDQLWQGFEEQLTALEQRKKKKSAAKKKTAAGKEPDLAFFPARFRTICNHYALAKSRNYSPALAGQLHQLVLRGHQQLYRSRRNWFWPLLGFLGHGFPAALRRRIGYFWIALLLFYGPAALCGWLSYTDPVMIYSVMDEQQVAQLEYMYDPQNRKPGRDMERSSDTDIRMFGYYIMHNISIGFRTFSGGMFMGIGTVFFLSSNGVLLGAISGHLSHAPFAGVFWPFVAGHGAFELTAIVISGAAGLILARALVMPGSLRRGTALKLAAPHALRLIMGAAVMLVIAAFVEAFWSSSPFPAQVRYAVAAVNWLAVIAYLTLAGRKSDKIGHES
jgi:uncharacterized membrane protein SpoIIM required for sporulation